MSKVSVCVCYGCLLRLNIFELKIISYDTSQTRASTSQLLVLMCVSADSEQVKTSARQLYKFLQFSPNSNREPPSAPWPPVAPVSCLNATMCADSLRKFRRLLSFFFFFMAQQPPVRQALLFIGVLWSHAVRLLWTSDQPGALTYAWQHAIQELDDHASGVIRTHNPSKRAVADSRLRPRDDCDRLSFYPYRTNVENRVSS